MNSENLSNPKHVRQRSNSKSRKLTSQEADQRAIPKGKAGNVPLPTTNQLATISSSLGTCAALGVIGVLILVSAEQAYHLRLWDLISRTLVLGVIATAVLAVILGHLASRQIKRSGGKKNGQGRASIGIILGYLIVAGLFLVPFLLIILITGGDLDGIVYLWNIFYG